MDFRTLQWNYINEGNVHIVLQIRNTDYVLRLIKEDRNSVNLQGIQNAIKFVNLVMMPLICDGSDYHEEFIEISTESLVYLSEKLASVRPEYRKNKSVLCNLAIKAPNLTLISQNNINYCIEIKPKEGFKSKSFQNLPKCYYCLKQFLKLQEKQIDAISHYCPLNLFSGDRKRMKLALRSLLLNPQNNFKMFKNGQMIYNEMSEVEKFHDIIKSMEIFSSSNLFLDFVINILLSDEGTLFESESASEPKSNECIEDNNLETHTFLYKLLYLQKLSENLNIDRELKHIKDVGSNYDYVSKILQDLDSEKLQLILETDKKKFLENTNPSHLALISAVAKDCSIMITFSSESILGFPNIQVGDHKISYRAMITDLEPKPFTTLLKRKCTEKKLFQVYQKYNDSGAESV